MIILPEVLKVTPDHIKALAQCPDDWAVAVWTRQHSEVESTVKKNGTYVASRGHAFSSDKPWKPKAYKWMTNQMRQRGLPIGAQALPVWGFLSPINQDCPGWEARPDDVPILLHVPRHRILISFHDPWSKFIGVVNSPRQHLDANDEHTAEHAARGYMVPGAKVCLKSWERMFDLGLVNTPGFKWGYKLP